MSLKSFFKSGKEAVRLAHVLDTMSKQIKVLLGEIAASPNPAEDCKETLYVLMYHSVREIFDRIDENNFPLTHKLLIPDIDKNWVTIGYALRQTVSKLNLIAVNLGLEEGTREIMDKGPLYLELENLISTQNNS